MCGRYALGMRATYIRHRMRDNGMPAEDAPEDDEVRETYNFAPGNIGIVYRAVTPPTGAGTRHRAQEQEEDTGEQADQDHQDDREEEEHAEANDNKDVSDEENAKPVDVKYKLQAMKWGLVPFWTKRDPGYGGLMKTINARDDSLASNGGMWNTMKKTKRCIVVAQGFFEWLKKDGGKVKVPHFVKRKDGELMCFAGLWDCVQYEGKEDQMWTYTIITTNSNKQLGFLHDRMPVILDNGSENLRKWLDPDRAEWNQELQSLLRPYDGELDCYPVNKDVGKVGNNSPDFIVPIDSAENKSNIANFFGNAKPKQPKPTEKAAKRDFKDSQDGAETKIVKDECRDTVNVPRSEDNAPMPVSDPASGFKRKLTPEAEEKPEKQIKLEDAAPSLTNPSIPSPDKASPSKASNKAAPSRKTRSATSNGSAAKQEKTKDPSSQKITSFFTK